VAKKHRAGAKKTFTLRVTVIGRKVPDWGLGRGVLSVTEVTFKDERGWGFRHPTFLMALHEQGEKFLHETVRVEVNKKVAKVKKGSKKSA